MSAKKTASGPGAPSFMDPTLTPWVLVSELYWMSSKLLERRLYHLGVSAPQSRALAALYYAAEPMKPSLVATLLFQEAQSITGIFRLTESRGWVVSTPDPNDHRAVRMQLTDAGRKLTSEIVQIMRDLYDELFTAALSATERHQVEASLRKVRALGFKLSETDFKLRRAQQFSIWKD
jgi:DNA-binding MarR family transcriptional regulator